MISCGQTGRSLFAGTDLLRGSCRLPRGEHFCFIEVVVQEGRWAALRSELREGWNPFENYSTDPFCPSSPRRAARDIFSPQEPPWPSSLFYSAGWSSEAQVRSSSRPRPCFFAARWKPSTIPTGASVRIGWNSPGGISDRRGGLLPRIVGRGEKNLMARGVWINRLGRGLGPTGDRSLSFCGLWTGAGSSAVWNRAAFGDALAKTFPHCRGGGTPDLFACGILYCSPSRHVVFLLWGGWLWLRVHSEVVHLHWANSLAVCFRTYRFGCAAILIAGLLFRLVASGWLYRRLPAWEIWASLAGSVWLATATFLFLGLSRQIGDARHAVFRASF